jgi:hypothetical protein
VANIYYDERFGERGVPELTLIGYPEDHIRSFDDGGSPCYFLFKNWLS